MEHVQRGDKATRFTAALVRSRRDLNNGFGEALSRAFELALTPAIFAVLGHLLDRRLDTSPLFALVLFLFVASYLTWRMFLRYDAEMKAEEERLRAPRRPSGP